MSEETREEPKPKEPLWKAVREHVEAIVIAFTFALIIRCFFIEVFEIPTSSMEPTLLGQDSGYQDGEPKDPSWFRDYHTTAGGDRIMVTKYYYGLGPVERFDVVVFKYPLNLPKNFIKRVVGLPGEEFLVYEGNIYTRPSGSAPWDPFRIAVKPQRTQDSIWIRLGQKDGFLSDLKTFRSYWSAEGGQSGEAFQVRDQALTTLGGSRDLTFQYAGGFVDYSGARVRHRVDDLRLALTFELADEKSRFVAAIENRYGKFTVRLGGTEPNALIVSGGDREETIALQVPIKPDVPHRLELMAYDGVCLARVNGHEARKRFLETLKEAQALDSGSRSVSFGVLGGAVVVRDLKVQRDIHYAQREDVDHVIGDEPIEIPSGRYLMMGDNTLKSQDSRAWEKQVFLLKGGRRVECDPLEIVRFGSELKKLAQEHGLDPVPYKIVKSDVNGNVVPLYEDQIEKEFPEEPAPFVQERHIVGKALWIWFPWNRAGKLIR